MKKLFLLMLPLLFLSGCSVPGNTPGQNTGNDAIIPQIEQNTLIPQATGLQVNSTSNLSRLSDSKIGISFQYPNNWGTITQELGTWDQLTYGVTLGKKIQTNIFLAAYNGNPVAPRGAYWGDGAISVSSSTYISNFCTNKTNCTLHTNSNGIPYVKYYFEEGIMGSDETKSIILYYIFNPNSSFRGIVISNANMINEPEINFDTIVESLSFL